jgi:hypothetical protein
MQKYGEATSEHQKRLAEWEVTKQAHPDAKRPDATDVFELDLLDISLQGSDHLSITLHTNVKPHETNGSWSPEKQAVTWSQSIPAESADRWPVLCYAFWSEPDAKYQEARFGRVLLAGQELAEFCTWYAGLTAEERGEWDALLASEPAGQPLLQRIQQFRFRGDPPAKLPQEIAKGEEDKQQAAPSLADKPRSLLKAAVEGKQNEGGRNEARTGKRDGH